MIGNRRQILQLLGATPLAAKAAAEVAAAELAGITGVGVTTGGKLGGEVVSESGLRGGSENHLAVRALMNIPELAAEFRSALYEDHRFVHHIDADLAAKRSFSLGAKITFQRQRNVEALIDWRRRDPKERAYERIAQLIRQFGGSA